eukprot:6896367-Alexandrium_andersonii.AAC.1
MQEIGGPRLSGRCAVHQRECAVPAQSEDPDRPRPKQSQRQSQSQSLRQHVRVCACVPLLAH